MGARYDSSAKTRLPWRVLTGHAWGGERGEWGSSGGGSRQRQERQEGETLRKVLEVRAGGAHQGLLQRLRPRSRPEVYHEAVEGITFCQSSKTIRRYVQEGPEIRISSSFSLSLYCGRAKAKARDLRKARALAGRVRRRARAKVRTQKCVVGPRNSSGVPGPDWLVQLQKMQQTARLVLIFQNYPRGLRALEDAEMPSDLARGSIGGALEMSTSSNDARFHPDPNATIP